jgi:hypothetical protein
MMAEPEMDKFKVWPTQLDREQFSDVITAGSSSDLLKKHPIVYRKHARKPEVRPRMVEAYFFFYHQMTEFFLGIGSEEPIEADIPIAQRLEECFQALKNALQVVAIDLEQDDDPQVIFETLNARGEPLLPADLLRNFIFLRAARRGESPEALYDEFWQGFDEPFWRVEVKQGRLLRPRSDLFMQHFLASRQAVDIPIKHLFVEYKFWIERNRPFDTVREELGTLARQREHFRRIVEPKNGDPIFGLVTFLDAFDVRTSYPLLFTLLDADLDAQQWKSISTTIESYLLRRAVCGQTTKNYNRIFLMLTRNLRRDGVEAGALANHLAEQNGESGEWPSDSKFGEAWASKHAYQTLNNAKIVYILKRLSDSFLGGKTEVLTYDEPLTVEHILPQAWIQHWPLPNGSRGMAASELWTADPAEPRASATRARNSALQTFGNLTILSQRLNSAVSNSRWEEKKPELLLHSLLPLNQILVHQDTWDEMAIAERGNVLFRRALEIWPRAVGVTVTPTAVLA